MFYTIADMIASRVSAETLARMYTSTPLSMQQGVALHRFRRTVRWAADRSVFYKKAFAEHGIDPARVRTPADLKDFYTTPDDLASHPEEFLCEPANIVFESSGTSGRNKRVYYSKADLHGVGMTGAAGFRLMGVTPQDRVANAFDFSIWIPGMVCHMGLMEAGNFCQAFGKCDPVEVWRRMDQYKFTVVLGEPTWLIRLTQIAEREGGGKLNLLIGGAEEMPAEAVKWMSKVWGGATVKMCYASVETASGIGFQPCSKYNGYHLDTSDFLTEIIEPDAEGYGEVVFSTLCRRAMPLIRYRTRDVAKILPGICECGIPAPRMTKIRGRRDELVVASGGNLYPLMFENILKDVPGLTHDWQVVFSLEGVREILEINVETNRTDLEALEAEIHAQATALYPDLMKNLALGIFEMRVIVQPPSTVRTARKLKRLVDRRHFEPAPETSEPVLAASNGYGSNGHA